jgi:hypothetical protein
MKGDWRPVKGANYQMKRRNAESEGRRIPGSQLQRISAPERVYSSSA